MSAPDTDLEKQEKRHKGPLVGMGLAVIAALLLLFVFVSYLVSEGGEPQGAETQIDGRTGIEAPAETDGDAVAVTPAPENPEASDTTPVDGN